MLPPMSLLVLEGSSAFSRARLERRLAQAKAASPGVAAASARFVHVVAVEGEALTPREREVLEEMAQGSSNVAIARDLVISEGAVEKHISSIFAKLDLPPSEAEHRRVRAVLTFLQS